MQGKKSIHAFVTTGAALALLLASSAQAQERKSIRLATASVDTYGYKVAAALVKIAEEALGGEYTVVVNPYPATTAAMKATMDGNAELGYTADIGMTELYGGDAAFKNYKPGKGTLVHTWYAYPMETFIAVPADKAAQYKCLKDSQRQADILLARRLHELVELPAHLQGAGLRLQACADRSEDAGRCAEGRHHRRLGRLHHRRRLARALLERDRNPHGCEGRQSLPGRNREAESRGSKRRRGQPEGFRQGCRGAADQRRADPVRASTCAPTCRKTWSIAWSPASTKIATRW